MAVAIDARGSLLVTTLTATVAKLYNGLTVSGAPNGALVLFVSLDVQSDSLNCVWDPSGANQALTQMAGNDRSNILCLLNPAPGNLSLSITPIHTQSAYIEAIALSGVDQGGINTSFIHATSNFDTIAAATLDVTSQAGDLVLGAINASDAISSFGQDEIYRSFSLGAGHQSGGATDAPGAGTVTLTATIASAVAWAMCGLDVLAAPSASGSSSNLAKMGIG
jgi:hypothetical protein